MRQLGDIEKITKYVKVGMYTAVYADNKAGQVPSLYLAGRSGEGG